MFKKMLFTILGSLMLMSCKTEPAAVKGEEEKKSSKKSVEIKYDFSDFGAMADGVSINGQSMRIIIKNKTSDPKEVLIPSMTINGAAATFYLSLTGPDNMTNKEISENLILMGESEESIWVKFVVQNKENKPIARMPKFPMLVYMQVKDIKTGNVIYIEMITDKDGKVLYEKVNDYSMKSY